MSVDNSLFGEANTPDKLFRIFNKLTHMKYSDYDNAIAELDELEDEYRDRPEFYALKGSLYQLNKEYQSSVDSLSISILLNAENATYFHSRGYSYFQNEDFYEALDDFNMIINTKSLENRDYFLSDCYDKRILIYCCLGQWSDAERELVHPSEDYTYYLEPIKGAINKSRIRNAINKRDINWGQSSNCR